MTAKNSKAQKNAVAKANDTFALDKASIIQAYVTSTEFDWGSVRVLLEKYASNQEQFNLIRYACMERTIVRAGFTETRAHELVRHNQKTNDMKPNDDEAKAIKSARNAWFYFTSRAGIKSLNPQGGNNNPTGHKGGASRSTDKPTSKPSPTGAPIHTSPTQVKLVPLASAKASTLAELIDAYDLARVSLIKLQAANATLFVGETGNAMLALHKEAIEALTKLTAKK